MGLLICYVMAEDMGFEPMQAVKLLAVFETAPLNLLGNPPGDMFIIQHFLHK